MRSVVTGAVLLAGVACTSSRAPFGEEMVDAGTDQQDLPPSSCDPPVNARIVKRGRVSIHDSDTSSAFASFRVEQLHDGRNTVTTIDGCIVTESPGPGFHKPTCDSVSRDTSAGTIRIDGLKSPIVLEPGVPNGGTRLFVYDDEWTFEDFWVGGETITIEAAGGEVPAFRETVLAARRPTLLSPVVGPGVRVSRADGIALRWRDVSTGFIATYLSWGYPRGAWGSVHCRFEAASGAAVISAAALASIPHDMTALFGVSAEETTELVAGEWQVRLEVGAGAIDTSGAIVRHRITLD